MRTKKRTASNFPKVKVNPKNTVVGESMIYSDGQLFTRKARKTMKAIDDIFKQAAHEQGKPTGE